MMLAAGRWVLCVQRTPAAAGLHPGRAGVDKWGYAMMM